MKKFSLVEFSVTRPWAVMAVVALLTIAFASRFPGIRIDTNPKNMLPESSEVRLWIGEVEKTFGLHEDMLALGIRNENGIVNRETLEKIERVSGEIVKIQGVLARDVVGLTTIDNVSADGDTLMVRPLMQSAPKTSAEVEGLRKALFGNPLFLDRIISKDGRMTAVYIPLEKGANAKAVADALREIAAKEKGSEEYYVAGDPVARDTFGSEMFKLMGLFSPASGMIMFIVVYIMFRSVPLALCMMGAAMISIVWSMGLLIGLGFPVHIMSSMAPVFLMAIATDSIHIFNEFQFRMRETGDKKAAIIATMAAVGRPVKYTALATAAGFLVLVFMDIIPVKVFGGLIAFGTVVLRFLSFSFIPAALTFISKEKIIAASQKEAVGLGFASRTLRRLARLGAGSPRAVILATVVAAVVSLAGAARINVNNNMVEWFKKGSEIRTADALMNESLGGTSLAYIVAIAPQEEYIKTPEAMRHIEGLQRRLERLPQVGKTTSVVDYVKRINRVLHNDDPAYERVPDSREAIGQYLFLFSMSAKPADLDNVVDYGFRKANIWVQLKSWDAEAMRDVLAAMDEYRAENPSPMELKPAGTAWFNLVWNDEVLWDMVKGFMAALAAVFIILVVNFRSYKWALVAYLPLLLTILVIYGVVGFSGKDFDMPISVLSCLSLGMAVDFAIHFISRLKERLKAAGEGAPDAATLADALVWTAERPGKGIIRNAVLFASAFSVMLFAPLTPYITVGAFIVSMMALSSLMTIVTLPAMITALRGRLF